MRITVFGATGRLGREIVRAARNRGHSVTAHARRPRSEPESGIEGIEWATGDAAEAVRHADAVLVAFGPRSPGDAPFCAAETGKILNTMAAQGVERILCVTGAMVGDYPRNRTWWFRQLAAWIERRYPESMRDRARQEELIRAAGTKWTIFKPPRLTSKPPRGSVAAGPAVRAGLLSSVTRADLARVMIEEVEQGRFPGQAVFVKRNS